MTGALDGRVALVTGGSKGLGAATASLFAEAGARVIVTFGNDAEAADCLITRLPGTGHRASHTPAQDTRAIESLAASIGTTEGHLDILVNNLSQMPFVAHPREATTDLVGELLAEFARPLPHGFVADNDAACGQQLLHHA
jgi:3-oxoacyl-[acyl-carrier protein] reductase